MLYLRWIPAIVVVAGSLATGQAQDTPTEQSLKAAHETMISSFKAGNLAVLQGMIHPRALGFFRESQFAAQLRTDYTAADAIPAVVADLGRFVQQTTDTIYRTVGQVGVVCMTSMQQPKQGEKVEPRYLRGTYVYVSEDGNWKLLSWHGSDTPLRQKK